jgi:iron-sulfur cluster repair protein YtfE (RIC family)
MTSPAGGPQVRNGAISSLMAGHHARCDELFAALQACLDQGDWNDAARQFRDLCEQIERHLQGEETVLFPAFESAIGVAAGPTAVMRQEHGRMRALLDQIGPSLAARDLERADGCMATLAILMRQHNQKEENILYPMLDAVLADGADELVGRLGLG